MKTYLKCYAQNAMNSWYPRVFHTGGIGEYYPPLNKDLQISPSKFPQNLYSPTPKVHSPDTKYNNFLIYTNFILLITHSVILISISV